MIDRQLAKISSKVAVASRTFSRHPALRAEMLSRFDHVTFNDEGLALSGDGLVQFLGGHSGAILALEKLNSDVIARLPELKVVSKYGVGLDSIDLDALKGSGKKLMWTGGVNRRAVAELTLVFMIGVLRNVLASTRLMANREWKNSGGTDLSGKTVGLIGGGFVGGDVLKLLRAFGCRVLVNDLKDVSALCREFGAETASKTEILKTCDVVSLHIPYTPENHHLIGPAEFALMKPSAVLVNTSRGGIVDEVALYEALKANRLGGAAMDVFATEPSIDSPLLGLTNFFGTPHIGGSSQEAILNMGRAAIEGLANGLTGSEGL
jgi:phosphoglycerate dehydrogenase-like enzyme